MFRHCSPLFRSYDMKIPSEVFSICKTFSEFVFTNTYILYVFERLILNIEIIFVRHERSNCSFLHWSDWFSLSEACRHFLLCGIGGVYLRPYARESFCRVS